MSVSAPAPGRRTRLSIRAALVVANVAIIGVFVHQTLAFPSFSAGAALGEAGGAVPEGLTVFDDHIPAVGNLDPALLGALRRAATDAGNDGVKFYVNSGWRTPAYQEQLLRDAVSKYGSRE